MRIKLNGKYYTLVRVHMPTKNGLCDHPNTPDKKIRVCTSLKNKPELEIVLHELLHAVDFTKDEEWVHTAAHDIAQVLWRLGYRKQPVDPSSSAG